MRVVRPSALTVEAFSGNLGVVVRLVLEIAFSNKDSKKHRIRNILLAPHLLKTAAFAEEE